MNEGYVHLVLTIHLFAYGVGNMKTKITKRIWIIWATLGVRNKVDNHVDNKISSIDQPNNNIIIILELHDHKVNINNNNNSWHINNLNINR